MELNKRLISFRKVIRLKRKLIIDTFISNHSSNICVFCATKKDITKEHVLPRWTFDGCTKKYFNTSTNGASQTYNRTVVPCCKNCNGFILGHLEHKIKHIFNNSDLSVHHFNEEELELIILWLETIAYKLQVIDIRRKFNKAKDSEYIPFLANFPIAIMQNNASLSPSKLKNTPGITANIKAKPPTIPRDLNSAFLSFSFDTSPLTILCKAIIPSNGMVNSTIISIVVTSLNLLYPGK